MVGRRPRVAEVAVLRWGPSVLISAGGTACILGRLLGDPAGRWVGAWRHPDMISNHWLYRWVSGELRSGRSILHNDAYYVPVGDAPWLAGNGSDAVLYTPLSAVVPGTMGLNLWIAGLLVLVGLGSAALVRAAGGGRWAMALGALVGLASPYWAGELAGARLAQVTGGWLALFLAMWWGLLRSGGVVRGVLAGVVYALAAFSYWFYGLWGAMIGLWWWALWPRWRPLLGFLPTVGLLLGPPLWIFATRWGEVPGTRGADAAFPSALARASSLSPDFLWSAVRPGGVVLSLAFLGVAALGLRRVDRRRALATALAAVVFFGLCLGPDLVVGETRRVWSWAPFRMVYGSLPALRRFWWPYRHVWPLTLCLLPLMGPGLNQLQQLAGGRWRRQSAGAAIVVGVVVVIELFGRGASIVSPASVFSPPVVYEQLARLPAGVTVTPPLAPVVAGRQIALSHQWVTRMPSLTGHALWVDRVRPRAWDDWVRTHPLWGAWRAFEEGRGGQTLAVSTVVASRLRTEGARYLILDADLFPGSLEPLLEAERAMAIGLWGGPVLESVGVWIFDLQGAAGDRVVELPAWSVPAVWAGRAPGQAAPEDGPSASWSELGAAAP